MSAPPPDREWLKRQEIIDLSSTVADERIDTRLKDLLTPIHNQLSKITENQLSGAQASIVLLGDPKANIHGEIPAIREAQALVARRQKQILHRVAANHADAGTRWETIEERLLAIEATQHRTRKIVTVIWRICTSKDAEGKPQWTRIVAISGSVLVFGSYLKTHIPMFLAKMAMIIRAISASI
jgi:hypothetical protein